MIALTPEALAHISECERYYIERQRPQALRNLAHSVAEAGLVILNAPHLGSTAPRPYPELASLGLMWLKRGRYWIAYDAHRPIIAGVFFDTDNIPQRFG